jgi:hypothetical protein
MARAYSAEYKSTLAKVSAEEAPVILLQIDHPGLPTPIRVVNDTQNLTSNGQEYIAFPFNCVLPDDFENKLPKARLTISNVGKDLMQWLEATDGGIGSTATFSQVMRSRPNQVEWTITMALFNVMANNVEVSAELGFENLFAKPAISVQYRPENSPGLFIFLTAIGISSLLPSFFNWLG